nr:MAG TPA: hypothetical protein [Caudoviricetes sp.]
MFLTVSFLSYTPEVTLIFIEWLIPFWFSIYFHSLRMLDTLGAIIFIQALCVTVLTSLTQSSKLPRYLLI